ncbi:unnamed protein product [Choristocarpus tenellus]
MKTQLLLRKMLSSLGSTLAVLMLQVRRHLLQTLIYIGTMQCHSMTTVVSPSLDPTQTITQSRQSLRMIPCLQLPPIPTLVHMTSSSNKGPVTDSNKWEFMRAKVRLILVGSRLPALEALRNGFAGGLQDLSPGAAPFLGLLSHADWRVLLCGEEHVGGPQVVAVLKWYNFPSSSRVPEWLKSLLLSFPEDMLRRFLIFVCGTPSLPSPSAGEVEVTVRCQPRSAALPAAHTCFFQLDIPDYDREAVLQHKVVQAVNNTAGFDMV